LTTRARAILAIGIPQAATSFTWSIVYPFMTVILTRFGMEALAAVSVGHRLESFGYHAANGFAVAIGALVAQAVGARDPERVRAVLREGLLIGGCVILGYAIVCIVWADTMAGWIASDPLVARHAADYLRVVSYFEVFILLEIALQGAFNGLGNSRPYMFICVPLTLARVPMAWVFAIHWQMGPMGVWWAISLSTFLKGAAQWVVFQWSPTNRRALAAMRATPATVMAPSI
jgi:Na+-driven multidrug efflux pump